MSKGGKRGKVPRRLFLDSAGKLVDGASYGVAFADNENKDDIEYTLAGSERRAVCRRLEKWLAEDITSISPWLHRDDVEAELKKIKED